MSYRTPVQIESSLEKMAYRMDNFVQWVGDEPNSYQKDWDSAEVRACLFACWDYTQAAGNQAIPLVYKTINEIEGMLCDRCYFPGTARDLRVLEKNGIPIHGIESKHQLLDFDVVGTSVSYPVLSINFVKQLMMSDIPPTWEPRWDPVANRTLKGRHSDPEHYPMVIVGGQGYGAPEVLANIVDVVFCGEAEDEKDNPGIGAVFERIADFKRTGAWSSNRMKCYEKMAIEFDFLYFPCFVDIHYDYEERETVNVLAEVENREPKPSKQVVGITSKLPGMRMPIKKRFVHDLDSVPPLTNPPLLYVDPGLGSGDLEAQRGCPAWCSFCALTYRQKPYRQRSVENMVKAGKELIENTGAIHISPFGPDFPMHTQKKKLIRGLLENVTDEISASSMRVDDFIADPSYILLQAQGGMDTVTLGVEGNSQRMRDLVGKGAADEDIVEAVVRGIQAGISKFKLYMIASLPGEESADIYRMLSLAKTLADVRDGMGSGAKIQFSWTPLLIEGNTPLQWFAPTRPNYVLGDVMDELRELNIHFRMGGKAQKDKMHYFQLTQRASREIGKAMVEAVAGMNQGCWGGAPRGLAELVRERLHAHGFHNDYLDAYDEREKHDMFGWEHIDQGINVELMWVTYQQMREFLENTDAETYDEEFGDSYHGNEWIERCLVEGTKVTLANGTTVPIEKVREDQWVLSRDADGLDAYGLVTKVIDQGERDLVEVEFEDGYVVRCTPDHRFRLVDGSWVEAQDLGPEHDVDVASWMGAYRQMAAMVRAAGVRVFEGQDERFFRKTEPWDMPDEWVPSPESVGRKPSPCVRWMGAKQESGHGVFRLSSSRKQVRAYRFAWERVNGPIPDGMVVNHICRRPECVNVDHLEVVTPRENQRLGLRGELKTHCAHGHSLEDAYVWQGRRHCRSCRRERNTARRAL